jgi:PTS system mannose-specific IIA component
MLIGEQRNVSVIPLQPEANISDVRATLLETYLSVNKGNGVVILVDMMGGSHATWRASSF